MKVNTTKDIGSLIRKRRKELGYTQGYIAEHTGYSTSFISDLENGKETAELGKALFLINLLGMDISISNRGGSHE